MIDLAVAQLLDVELGADAATERRDDQLDLLVTQHLVEARLLDVQDLALDRQDRLVPPVAAHLRRVHPQSHPRRCTARSLRGSCSGSPPACRAGCRSRGPTCDAPGRGPCVPLRALAERAPPFRRWPWPPRCSPRGRSPSVARSTTDSTMPCASRLPSLSLVCPSNCGSGTFSDRTAVKPSRKSSPDGALSASLTSFSFFA